MTATTEEEDEEVEDFLDKSEHLLELHGLGCDISDSVKSLKLPRIRTHNVRFIYGELKRLSQQSAEGDDVLSSIHSSSPSPPPLHNSTASRPCSPTHSHHCKCYHVVLPQTKRTDGLQAKDFVYLVICGLIGLAIYLYLYIPSQYDRKPVY